MTTAAAASLERVGFIGLGNMGGAIALRLLRAGYPMTILDLDADKMAGLVKEGATRAATPREVAERSTIVLASLQPDDVEKVACGADGIAESKNKSFVFVDLSSTTEQSAIKVSDSLRACGIEMLDSPVSGDAAVVELDIGIEQYPVGAVPQHRDELLAELQQQAEQI